MLKKVILVAVCSFAAYHCNQTSDGGSGDSPQATVPNPCPLKSSVTIAGKTTCSPTLEGLAFRSNTNGKYYVDVTFTNGSTEHLELSWPTGNPTGHFTCSAASSCGYGTPNNNLCNATGSFDVTAVGAGLGDRIAGTFSFNLTPVTPSAGNTCVGALSGSFTIIRGNDT